MKKIILGLVSVILLVVLAACGNSEAGKDKEKETTLVIGASNVPHAEILEKAKPILEKEQGAAYLLYGHGGPAPAPAHPFVRPAFDVKASDAFEEMKRVLRDEISNT